MKKNLIALLLIAVGVFSAGCERRDPNEGRLIPEGTTLEFQIWTAEEPDIIEALAREFVTASKSTGLQIKVIPFADDAELQRFLTHKMAEGIGPDVIFTNGDWIKKNPRKIIAHAADPSFSVAAFDTTFVRAASDAFVTENTIYGVPMAVDTLGIFYNEEYLIDTLESRNTPGKTWKEFRQDVESLSETNNSFERFSRSGVALGRVDNVKYGFDILENLLLQYKTEIFTPDGTLATFASSTGISPNGSIQNYGQEALEFFLSFADDRFKNYSWNEFIVSPENPRKNFESFVKGKTAMVFGYSRDLEHIEDLIARTPGSISPNNVRADFFPQSNTRDRELQAKTYGFSVPRTTENAELAWNFLKFAIKKNNLQSFHESSGWPSPRLDLIQEQSQDQNLGIFVRQAKFARARIWPLENDELVRGFENLVQSLNDKKNSAETLLRDLEVTINKTLTKFYKRESAIRNQLKSLPPSSEPI